MDNPVEFRRKGRGYNKDDVNSFISRENMRFNKLEESYNKAIREKDRELSELKQSLSERDADKDRMIELELKISELEEIIDTDKESLSEKEAIIEGLKAAVDSTNEKLELANSLIDDLRNRPVASSPAPAAESTHSLRHYDESIIEKAEKYDSICNKVDEILAFAKEEADKIISEALEIRKQTVKRTPSQMKNDIAERSESIIDELKRSIRRQLKGTK